MLVLSLLELVICAAWVTAQARWAAVCSVPQNRDSNFLPLTFKKEQLNGVERPHRASPEPEG